MDERERLLAELDNSNTHSQRSQHNFTHTTHGKQDYNIIVQQFMNETMSPEILPYETVAVQRLNQALLTQEEQVIEFESDHFVKNLLQIEFDRIRFALCSYMRARLIKIERYARHVVESGDNSDDSDGGESLLSRLSAGERHFCTRFAKLEREALERGNFLKNLDQSLMEGDQPAVNRPNMEQFVFCQVLSDIGRVQFDDDDDEGGAVSLSKGDTYILSYDMIKRYVQDGRIKLI